MRWRNIPGVEEASLEQLQFHPTCTMGDSFRKVRMCWCPLGRFAKPMTNMSKPFQLDIKVGRNFSEEFRVTKGGWFLMNCGAFVRMECWRNSAQQEDWISGRRFMYEVVGIVRDFHYWTIQTPIQPMAIFHKESSDGSYKLILWYCIKTGRYRRITKRLLRTLKSWVKFAGDQPSVQVLLMMHSIVHFNPKKFSHGPYRVCHDGHTDRQSGVYGHDHLTWTALKRNRHPQSSRCIRSNGHLGIDGARIRVYNSGAIALSILVSIVTGAWLNDFSYHTQISPLAFVVWGILLIAIVVTNYHVIKGNTNPVNVLLDE